MKTHIIVRLIVDVDFLGDGIIQAQNLLEKEGFTTSRGAEYDLIAEKKADKTV